MQPGVQEFLAEKRIAVVGVSRTRGFGNAAWHELTRKGYQVFPVNAGADEVEGQRCWRRLADVPGPPKAVLAVVPPAETEKLQGIRAHAEANGVEGMRLLAGSEALALEPALAARILLKSGNAKASLELSSAWYKASPSSSPSVRPVTSRSSPSFWAGVIPVRRRSVAGTSASMSRMVE